MTFGDLPFEQRTINLCHGEHSSNVAEMFIAPAFAVEFQLVDNDILRRSEPQLRFTNVNRPPISQRPAVERIIGAEINIGLITALKMDDIEMSAPVARPFDFHDITRWSIKFILRKDALQGGNGFAVEEDDNVDVVRYPNFPIDHGRDRTGGGPGRAKSIEAWCKDRGRIKIAHAG